MSTTHWHSTSHFRAFRARNTRLSHLYWSNELGREAIKKAVVSAATEQNVIAAVGANSIGTNMLPETVSEFLAKLEERAGEERLHLLVVCSANLEAYLQDVIRLYLLARGYQSQPGKLTKVGEALGRPVLRSSTVSSMVSYCARLLGVDYGPHYETWSRAYKLRCAAAHSGGVVTPRVHRALSGMSFSIGEVIRLSWRTLKDYLAAAGEIVAGTDRAVARGCPEVLVKDVELTLLDWKGRKVLPPRDQLWRELHRLGFQKVPKSQRHGLISLAYE